MCQLTLIAWQESLSGGFGGAKTFLGQAVARPGCGTCMYGSLAKLKFSCAKRKAADER